MSIRQAFNKIVETLDKHQLLNEVAVELDSVEDFIWDSTEEESVATGQLQMSLED